MSPAVRHMPQIIADEFVRQTVGGGNGKVQALREEALKVTGLHPPTMFSQFIADLKVPATVQAHGVSRTLGAEPAQFKVGELNSTDAIRKVTAINQLAIADIEKAMQPRACSVGGYLITERGYVDEGAKKRVDAPVVLYQERLLDVMAEDNEFVLSRSLSHQALAFCLHYSMEALKVSDSPFT